MSENRNRGSKNQEGTNRGLGSKDEDLQARKQQVSDQPKKGSPRSEDVDEDDRLERDSTSGSRKNIGTDKRKDQEHGSSSGRSGSLGPDESKRRDTPNQGKK